MKPAIAFLTAITLYLSCSLGKGYAEDKKEDAEVQHGVIIYFPDVKHGQPVYYELMIKFGTDFDCERTFAFGPEYDQTHAVECLIKSVDNRDVVIKNLGKGKVAILGYNVPKGKYHIATSAEVKAVGKTPALVAPHITVVTNTKKE